MKYYFNVNYGYIQYKQLTYQEQSGNVFCCLLILYNDIHSGGCPADPAEQLDIWVGLSQWLKERLQKSVFGSFWAMQKERRLVKPKNASYKPFSIDYQ